jgi:hypothetical protein
MKNCLPNASPAALERLINRLPDIRKEYSLGSSFILAARSFPCCFLSSNSKRYHSIIREIAQVFTGQKASLVVSGTGLSLEDQQKTLASGVSKPGISMFHELGMFDTWAKLKTFIENYLPTHFLQSPSGHRLQKRMQEYLLGRWVDISFPLSSSHRY